MIWVLVGVRGCVPRPTGHSLVTLFSLSVSIKDRLWHGTWPSHKFIIPSTYLFMGAGRLVPLLSWVPALSGPTVIGGLWGWSSKHRSEAGPQVLGAWSPSLDGDLDPVTGG